MKLQEDLPKELIDILDSPEFDDEAGIVIASANWTDNNLDLVFSIKSNDAIMQKWKVKIQDVKEEKLSSEWSQGINFYSQHFLLLKYKDVYNELYINGTTQNWRDLFIDIFKSLLELSEGEDIEEYLFSPDRIKELSKQDYGLFASGSKTILQVYQKCLTIQGIKAYFINDIPSRNINKELMLFEIGDRYVIGRDFLFERIS